MKSYLRTFLGSLVALCGLGVFLFGLFQLIRGGSCASGGNYVSTRQCAPGSTAWMFALPPALLIGLAGLLLIARRGPRPQKAPPAFVFSRPEVLRPDLGQFHPQSGGAPAADPIARLERLQALRDAGALSQAEYERAKASVLADM